MQDIFIAIWHHDFDTLQQVSSLKGFLLLLGFILLLESSVVFLPLPGDSLVLFVGGLIGVGILDFYSAAGMLCLAASIGSIIAYIQGRYLNRTKLAPFLHRVLPKDSLPRAKGLLEQYGFLSLFVSRFIPFVRVLTPMLMGLSQLSVWRTVLISMTSSVTWCLVLLLSGKWLMLHPKLGSHQALLSKALLSVSVVLMLFAVGTLLVRFYASKSVPKRKLEEG